jgi:hypothetical protein
MECRTVNPIIAETKTLILLPSVATDARDHQSVPR